MIEFFFFFTILNHLLGVKLNVNERLVFVKVLTANVLTYIRYGKTYIRLVKS